MYAFIYAIIAFLAVFVAVTHGYALFAWKRGAQDGWYAGFFLMWNVAAAIVLVALAQFGLAQFGAAMAVWGLWAVLAVAMAPHVIVLAGNFAGFVSAMREGAGRGMIAVFVAWILVSMLSVVLLGAVSPNTFLIRVLL